MRQRHGRRPSAVDRLLHRGRQLVVASVLWAVAVVANFAVDFWAEHTVLIPPSPAICD